MKFGTKRIAGGLFVLAASFALAAGPVPHTAQGSGLNVFGTATLQLRGQNLTAHITASGLSPSLPHLMHIHGVIGAQNDCPNSSVAGRDGFIDTLDGLPAYGPVVVTFSTTGDTSAAAAFNLGVAVEATSSGTIDYTRTFTIPKDVAMDISNLHVVIHGADLNDNGKYDGKKSSLGMGIPLEAELPVSCGVIN